MLIEDPLEEEYRRLSDVPGYLRREIEQFFRTYQDLEGKSVKVKGWKSRKDSHQALNRAVQRYREQYPSR